MFVGVSLAFRFLTLRIINLLSLTDEDEELDSFVEEADSEGRVILSSFDNGFVLNVYFPANTE